MSVTVLFVVILLCGSVFCDNFPSLITTNATLVVVIDRKFVAQEYDSVRTAIENYIVYIKREILTHGGVNVQYYSWTTINVKREITAILSVASCSDTWRLFKSAEQEHILHMAISESDCPRLPVNQAITVPLIRRGQELPQLLLDLRTAKTYDWKSAIVLHDNTLNRDQVARIVKSLTLESSNLKIGAVAISLLKIETTNLSSSQIRDSLKDMLSQISEVRVGGNFLAILSIEIIDIVMEYAKSFELVDTKKQWLYVISDTTHQSDGMRQFKRLLKEGDNVAFLHNNTITDEGCKTGLKCHTEEMLLAFTRALDNAIREEFEIATQVSDEEWEAIRPTKQERQTFLLDNVKNHLLKYGQCDNCTSWLMNTGDTWGREYLPNLNDSEGMAEIIPVGNWRPSDGPSMSDELFPHVTHGFRGRKLPLMSFHNPPWQILKFNETGSLIDYSGLVFDIINELSETLNFTYSVDVIKLTGVDKERNRTFGNRNETITGAAFSMSEIADINTNIIPDGLIKLIQNKSIAIGACAFTVIEENKHFVNYTSPISTQSYSFLVSRPRELSRALLFMSPFTGDTWFCLSASIISMGPILYYIHRLSPVYEYQGIRSTGGLSSIQNCIWYMYGALLQQGGMHLPHADSARLVVGSWWLVVLVVATTYCGNLVAFLTFPKIDIPITTIDELLAHHETVSWSMTKGSFLANQLETSTEPRFKMLHDKKTDKIDEKNLIKKIEDGSHVFIDWKIRLQYIMKKQYIETGRCDLALGLDEFYDEQLAMIVDRNTPYLKIINEEIKKLHQVGLIQKWLKDYLPKRDRCWKNRHIVEVNNHTVNLDDMQGSFFVLFLGFFISLLIIVFEKLWHKYVAQRRHKSIQPFTS